MIGTHFPPNYTCACCDISLCSLPWNCDFYLCVTKITLTPLVIISQWVVSVGALRAIVDILQTLGGATLAVTTVVLGASMFPQNKSSDTVDKQATSGKPDI